MGCDICENLISWQPLFQTSWASILSQFWFNLKEAYSKITNASWFVETFQVIWWARRASRACRRQETVTTSCLQHQLGSQSWSGTTAWWRLWCSRRTKNRRCHKPQTGCFDCAATGEKRTETNISERSVSGLVPLT